MPQPPISCPTHKNGCGVIDSVPREVVCLSMGAMNDQWEAAVMGAMYSLDNRADVQQPSRKQKKFPLDAPLKMTLIQIIVGLKQTQIS